LCKVCLIVPYINYIEIEAFRVKKVSSTVQYIKIEGSHPSEGPGRNTRTYYSDLAAALFAI